MKELAKPEDYSTHQQVLLTSCLLLSGTRVPARTIISAGSVVNTVLTEELALYSGIPAVKIRDLPADLGYFVRTKPFID